MKETIIQLKRAKFLLERPETGSYTEVTISTNKYYLETWIADTVLPNGEPLHIDIDGAANSAYTRIIVIGDGLYEDDDNYIGSLTGSTVKELISSRKYFAGVNKPVFYSPTLIDYNSNSPVYVKDIDATINDYTIANCKFVQSVADNLLNSAVAYDSIGRYKIKSSSDIPLILCKKMMKCISEDIADLSYICKKSDAEYGFLWPHALVGSAPIQASEQLQYKAVDGVIEEISGKFNLPTGDSCWDNILEADINKIKKTPVGLLDMFAAYSAIKSKLNELEISLRSAINEANKAAAVSRKTSSGSVPSVLYVTGIDPDDIKNKSNFYDGSGGFKGGQYIDYKKVSESSYTSGVRIDTKKHVLMGAAWNDYAETRKCSGKPGTVVCETGNGTLERSSRKLQPGAYVITDTYGMVIGEEGKEYTPVAVAGRVLVNCSADKSAYLPGMPVCADVDGKAAPMSREECMYFPEAILGYVSEIPSYAKWNGIKVNDRIWIKVK